MLVIGFETELKTDGKLQMTREPAMKTLTRLTGIDAYASFGRGIKGRQRALEWLKEVIADTEAEHAKLTA